MKILLTGSSGNLGSHLMRIDKSITGITRDNWHCLNELMVSADIVVHAAYDLKNSISEHPAGFFDSNLMATMHLLESMKKTNTSRLYFISSCAVYGDVTHMREDVMCNPISINGIVKYLNEKVIAQYCLDNGIKFTFLRLFNTYAGNDTFSVLNKLRRAAYNNECFNLNNGGLSQRDFIHVEDVASIIMKLIDVEPSDTCINIGSGKAVKIFDLFQAVKKNHPLMKVKKTNSYEIEYARADTTRLLSLVPHDFLSVFSYIDGI